MPGREDVFGPCRETLMTGRITRRAKREGRHRFLPTRRCFRRSYLFRCASTAAGMNAIPRIVPAVVPARADSSEGATRPICPRSKGEGPSEGDPESPSARTGWSLIPTGRQRVHGEQSAKRIQVNFPPLLETVRPLSLRRYWLALLFAGAACALQGCNGPPAPSPTPNPHPQHTVKLKITVEKGSEVNRVEVKSLWVVSNLSCAPVIWPAGNTRVKQVEVPERVEKMGDSYIATIVMDRFLHDKCEWINGGLGARVFRGGYWLSNITINNDVVQGKTIYQLTCLTRPFVDVGTCAPRDEESFYKSEDKNAFNVTVEKVP